MIPKMVPTKTSEIISIVVIHAARPAGTPLRVNHAILTISPPMYDGVVCETNSEPSLAEIVLEGLLTSCPINFRIKYLNLYACNKTLPITAAEDRTNGMTPTDKRSSTVMCVKSTMRTNGTMLAGIASIRQFKIFHPSDKMRPYKNPE